MNMSMDLQKIKGALVPNREKIYRTMTDVARKQETISYSDLFGEYGLDMGDISHRNEAGNFLGDICREEHDNNRPLLSVVVVHAKDNQPGPGFWNIAHELGLFDGNYSSESKDKFFIDELNKVYNYFSQQPE